MYSQLYFKTFGLKENYIRYHLNMAHFLWQVSQSHQVMKTKQTWGLVDLSKSAPYSNNTWCSQVSNQRFWNKVKCDTIITNLFAYHSLTHLFVSLINICQRFTNWSLIIIYIFQTTEECSNWFKQGKKSCNWSRCGPKVIEFIDRTRSYTSRSQSSSCLCSR